MPIYEKYGQDSLDKTQRFTPPPLNTALHLYPETWQLSLKAKQGLQCCRSGCIPRDETEGMCK